MCFVQQHNEFFHTAPLDASRWTFISLSTSIIVVSCFSHSFTLLECIPGLRRVSMLLMVWFIMSKQSNKLFFLLLVHSSLLGMSTLPHCLKSPHSTLKPFLIMCMIKVPDLSFSSCFALIHSRSRFLNDYECGLFKCAFIKKEKKTFFGWCRLGRVAYVERLLNETRLTPVIYPGLSNSRFSYK